MRALSAAELLRAWEQGFAASPAQRALILVALIHDEAQTEPLPLLTVGERDAYLLSLREETFGSRLTAITGCPACSEQLEFQVDAADLRATTPAQIKTELQLTHAHYHVEFRLPTSFDLASLDPAAGIEGNRQDLLRRCVMKARLHGREVEAAELPPEVSCAISQRMAEADPQADMQFALACPRCRHEWQTPFDIVSYLWTEIHTWAGRLLREVHSLASAYGWREEDVLALSPWRRQGYLELIGS